MFSIHCFFITTPFSLTIFLVDNELIYFKIIVLYTLIEMPIVSMANNFEIVFIIYFVCMDVLSACTISIYNLRAVSMGAREEHHLSAGIKVIDHC